MQSKKFLVICSAALSLGLAAPVLAQTSGGGSMSGGSSNGSMSGGSGNMDRHSGTGGSMGTPATESGTGNDERPGKPTSGAPQTDNMSK